MLNITHPYKESKLSTNYSFDPPHFFVKKNYDLECCATKCAREYTKAIAFILHSAISVSAGVATFPVTEGEFDTCNTHL